MQWIKVLHLVGLVLWIGGFLLLTQNLHPYLSPKLPTHPFRTALG